MKCSLIKAYNQQTTWTFGNQTQGQCKYQAHMYFNTKLKELKEATSNKVLPHTATASINWNVMEASYRIPFLTEKTEMPHMSTESTLKAVNKIMGTMLGKKDCKELNAPALSNNEHEHRTGDE